MRTRIFTWCILDSSWTQVIWLRTNEFVYIFLRLFPESSIWCPHSGPPEKSDKKIVPLFSRIDRLALTNLVSILRSRNPPSTIQYYSTLHTYFLFSFRLHNKASCWCERFAVAAAKVSSMHQDRQQSLLWEYTRCHTHSKKTSTDPDRFR